ncbi:hypothetical protein C4D60_Mb05t30900 [Musa balbisiana]|uniref:DNA-directed RNA polymerase subunit n=1 Tax=Musa balbisiana TaxID=52838 RepID=A0A4V4H8J7_MUSBA|nr:hypothetical protein C4D60_Mb05t30900 [Musa balbisiana]
MAPREEKLRCTKEPYIEDVGPQRIKSIRFSTFSGEEIKKLAEVQVWNNRIYGIDLRPVENGLLDPKMGAANKTGVCATCHGNFTECPGHFGYLKLTLPVFNVGYFNSILNVLKCICKVEGLVFLFEFCSVFFLLNNGVVKKARASFAIAHDFSRSVDESIEVVRAALSHIKAKSSFQIVHVLSPVTVLSLFKRMVDQDCELLNLYDRPEKLIVTTIAVPPVAVRPSVFVDFGKSSNEDSITSILKNIINTNSILREDLEGAAPPFKCLDCWAHLQIQVVEYINSEAPSVPDSKHRGLIQRLKGKQGRFRGNLSGKRVEFTGRTVISPDPNLKITEVAIPVLMAKKLTYPERVSAYNIEKLRQRICNGPDKYPGANFILLGDGTKQHLRYVDKKTAASELKYGYIVERHLEDGDVVLFNRQPSLHRMSIMCHRARIMPWRTLRFNESVCNPYNADFDGDEMNLHVPQTEEARTEALMLMGPIELWTGKQLFSVLIRPNARTKVFLNLMVKEKIYTKSETMCPCDGYIYFRNSELICGQLGKVTLGNLSSNHLD